MVTETRIKEIFESIQGEGIYVGCNQLFIRFCGCNLNCNYCDTDFGITNSISYSAGNLIKEISVKYDFNRIHSVSLTGGEPLLHTDFLLEFLPKLKEKNIKVYLETNATLASELLKIKNFIDIISADIKLPSSTGYDSFELHENFFKNCVGVETFAKIVFDNKITDAEIERCLRLGEKYKIELILQPKMNENNLSIDNEFCQKIFYHFVNQYQNVRLIPQVHKFLNVR